jgi:hypothetical protein
MRDSPFADAKAVLVTFSSVRAHRSDSDWTVVPFMQRRHDAHLRI